MFCQGLGDCFLISIPQEGDRPYWMLIDCGIAMNTDKADAIMSAVVNRIVELTGGVIDLLVITHEHYDHVSGFAHAAGLLTKSGSNAKKAAARTRLAGVEGTAKPALSFKHFWFAWTDDPKDTLAGELRAKYSKAKAAVARAAAAMKGEARQRLRGILAFNGLELLAAGKPREDKMALAMENLRSLYDPNGDMVDYLRPRDIEKLPGAMGGTAKEMRAFVLGPPHSAAKVRKTNPGKTKPETYHKKGHAALSLDSAESWSAALGGHSAELGLDVQPEDNPSFAASMPFEKSWRIDKPEKHSAFNGYFATDAAAKARRIDDEWLLRGAQRLALHIESYTNNTSLVLALELPKSGKVLLFPGDAQVGNWLSWHDEDFVIDDNATVSATDLLGRTVLYKVGHHGSHNATLKEKGLELMNHRQLVAMIPVESGAVKRLSYGEMPLESLVTELVRRCDGRVLRLDEKWTAGKSPGTWSGLERATQSSDVISDADGRPFFMEYTILDKK
jgi:hypothetical protein